MIIIFLWVPPLIILIREQTLPLVLALEFCLDPQLHLFANDGFEDKGFIWRDGLPVLYPSSVDRPRAFS